MIDYELMILNPDNCEEENDLLINGVSFGNKRDGIMIGETGKVNNKEIHDIQCGESSDRFAFAVPEKKAYERAKSYVDGLPPSERPLNIMYISMDSLSRAQFYRKLSKTSSLIDSEDFRKKMDVFHMESFNCNGDGTLKTMVPMLTGWDDEDFKNLPCGFKNCPNKIDLKVWPWIWYELKERGYVTTWLSDSCMDIWSLNLAGFAESPTDHPLGGSSLFCQGGLSCGASSRHSHEHVLGYFQSLLSVYSDVGVAAVTHLMDGHEGSLAVMSRVDVGLPKFVDWIANHHGNDTVLVLGGDHGPRYGEYRQTMEGKLEERLPMLVWIFPKWISSRYPRLSSNLETNKRKLATPYDLHETLRHVMTIHHPKERSRLPKKAPYAVSLLEEIPVNRTCESARLPPHWCSCRSWSENLLESTPKEELAAFEKAVLDYVNTQTGYGEEECHLLSVEKYYSVRKRDLLDKMKTYDIKAPESGRWSSKTALDYLDVELGFIVKPGGGVFEAAISVKKTQENIIDDVKVKHVSRISRHDYQSSPCNAKTKANINEKYCVCKNWVPSNADNVQRGYGEKFGSAYKAEIESLK